MGKGTGRNGPSPREVDSRLWNAGIKLFASKGFAATGIREIADQAGLSISALYYYVDNKEDLLLQIMRGAQERLVTAGGLVAERLKEPEVALAGLVELHVIAQGRFRLEAVVIDNEIRALGPDGRKQVIDLRDEYEAHWNDVLSRGSADGVFTFANIRTTRLALLEMCNGVAAWFSPDGELDIAQVGEQFVDLALALVRAKRNGRALTVADLDLPTAEWFMSLVDNAVPWAAPQDEVAATGWKA